ncbi:hypothetical protein HK102_009639, partial [Quaeritorhiza haematococci]
LRLVGVVPGDDGTAVAKRDGHSTNTNTNTSTVQLKRRRFSSFTEWLERISRVSASDEAKFEMSQSVEQVLFDARGQCIRDGQTLTSNLRVSVAGSAFARGTFGVFVSGHLAPTPQIEEAYVYFKAEAGARMEFDLTANVNYEKREIARVASIPLTPFQIPGVGSIGPLLELDVGYDARFSMNGAFKAAVNVNLPPIHVAYGDKNAAPQTSSPIPTAQSSDATGSAINNAVQPSLQVDFQAQGSVDLFVIPKATLDIDLLSGFLDAQVGLSAQAGLTGRLSGGASAGVGAGTGQAGTATATAQACLGLEASANADLFAQGTAFWTQTATTSVSLYSLQGVSLFERCFGGNNNNNNSNNNSGSDGSPTGTDVSNPATNQPAVPGFGGPVGVSTPTPTRTAVALPVRTPTPTSTSRPGPLVPAPGKDGSTA